MLRYLLNLVLDRHADWRLVLQPDTERRPAHFVWRRWSGSRWEYREATEAEAREEEWMRAIK